jgi:putative Mn2+ efflux pump MntP
MNIVDMIDKYFEFGSETLPRWIGNILFVVIGVPFIVSGFVSQKTWKYVRAWFLTGWISARDFD